MTGHEPPTVGRGTSCNSPKLGKDNDKRNIATPEIAQSPDRRRHIVRCTMTAELQTETLPRIDYPYELAKWIR
jgi:hypothetical protein